jgi:hypothetical protein
LFAEGSGDYLAEGRVRLISFWGRRGYAAMKPRVLGQLITYRGLRAWAAKQLGPDRLAIALLAVMANRADFSDNLSGNTAGGDRCFPGTRHCWPLARSRGFPLRKTAEIPRISALGPTALPLLTPGQPGEFPRREALGVEEITARMPTEGWSPGPRTTLFPL